MAGGSLARLERLAVLGGASLVRPARWEWIDPCLALCATETHLNSVYFLDPYPSEH